MTATLEESAAVKSERDNYVRILEAIGEALPIERRTEEHDRRIELLWGKMHKPAAVRVVLEAVSLPIETMADACRAIASAARLIEQPSKPWPAVEAAPYLDSITALVKALTDASQLADDDAAADASEKAQQAIHEDALSVQVRADWHDVGGSSEPTEFHILIATGSPAVRIIGTLDREEPDTARLEFQDWGTPWTPVPMTEEQAGAVLEYARAFYFGA